jgi:hypothetical protein
MMATGSFIDIAQERANLQTKQVVDRAALFETNETTFADIN